MPQPTGTTGSGVIPSRHRGISTIPISPTRTSTNEQSTSTVTAIAPNIGSTVNENGNLFTLTNIYTFGDNGRSNPTSSTDKYHVKSFVEVFDQPSPQHETEYERHYRETHSSSSVTRKTHTSSTDTHDYDASRFHHQFDSTSPSTTKYVTGS